MSEDPAPAPAGVTYTNWYTCPGCGHEWVETWSCGCDSTCPSCGTRDVSPTSSTTPEPEKPVTAPQVSTWIVGVKISGQWDIEAAGPTWPEAVAKAKEIAQRHLPDPIEVEDVDFPGSDTAVEEIFGQLPARGFQDWICESVKVPGCPS